MAKQLIVKAEAVANENEKMNLTFYCCGATNEQNSVTNGLKLKANGDRCCLHCLLVIEPYWIHDNIL